MRRVRERGEHRRPRSGDNHAGALKSLFLFSALRCSAYASACHTFRPLFSARFVRTDLRRYLCSRMSVAKICPDRQPTPGVVQ